MLALSLLGTLGLMSSSLSGNGIGVAAQKSVSLHATMNINKQENMTQILEDGKALLSYAKDQKLHQNLIIFLENTEKQLKSLTEA